MFCQLRTENRGIRLSVCAVLAVAVSLLAMPSGDAFAQVEEGGYQFFRVAPNLDLKPLRQIKNNVASGGAYASNKDNITTWYTQYFFRSFSQPSEVASLAAKRRELVKDLRTSARSPEFRKYLMATTWTYMYAFTTNDVKGTTYNFHPAVRYNAMLVIGEMNATEQGAARQPAVPLPSGLTFMMDQLNDPNQIDIVRVAALLGILRHARLDWSKDQMPKKLDVANKMIELASDSQVPEGRSAEVHLWMRRRAVDVLASLGAIGKVPNSEQAIESLVADSDENILLRCTAARALSLVRPEAKMDFVLASARLGALAASATRYELAWIDEYKRRKAAEEATPGAGEAGVTSTTGQQLDTNDAAQMMGVEIEVIEDDQSTGFEALGGTGAPSPGDENPEVTLAQRRFLTKLVCVSKGLKGLEDALDSAKPEDKAKVDDAKMKAIRAQLDALMAATNPPEDDFSLDGLAKNIKKATRDMDRLTENLPPLQKAVTPVSAPVTAAPIGTATPTGS